MNTQEIFSYNTTHKVWITLYKCSSTSYINKCSFCMANNTPWIIWIFCNNIRASLQSIFYNVMSTYCGAKCKFCGFNSVEMRISFCEMWPCVTGKCLQPIKSNILPCLLAVRGSCLYLNVGHPSFCFELYLCIRLLTYFGQFCFSIDTSANNLCDFHILFLCACTVYCSEHDESIPRPSILFFCESF